MQVEDCCAVVSNRIHSLFSNQDHFKLLFPSVVDLADSFNYKKLTLLLQLITGLNFAIYQSIHTSQLKRVAQVFFPQQLPPAPAGGSPSGPGPVEDVVSPACPRFTHGCPSSIYRAWDMSKGRLSREILSRILLKWLLWQWSSSGPPNSSKSSLYYVGWRQPTCWNTSFSPLVSTISFLQLVRTTIKL